MLARIGALVAEEALLAEARADVLPLTGAPRVELPEHVRSAASAALKKGELRVPSRGLPQLRAALAHTLSRQTGRALDPDRNLLVTNGGMHAVGLALRALVERGAEVVIPAPAFLYQGALHAAGLLPRYVAPADGGWAWDIEAIDAAITPRTAAILVCNPVNPTGHSPPPAAVAALAEIAGLRGILLISDESYSRFTYEPAVHTSLAGVPGIDAVVAGSTSKSYAMSSWRVGWLTATSDQVDRCLPWLEWDAVRCGYVAQEVAASAVAGPQEWMDETVRRYRRNRDAALRMQVPGLPRAIDAGAFLFLRGIDARVLREAGIPAVEGEYFQAPGFARVPFGGPIAAIAELERRLQEELRPAHV